MWQIKVETVQLAPKHWNILWIKIQVVSLSLGAMSPSIQLKLLPVANVTVCCKSYNKCQERRSCVTAAWAENKQQTERVMPSCTLLWIECQAENQALDVYKWGRWGEKILGIVNPRPYCQSLIIHTVCATWSYSYMPGLLRGISPFSGSNRKGEDSDTVGMSVCADNNTASFVVKSFSFQIKE